MNRPLVLARSIQGMPVPGTLAPGRSWHARMDGDTVQLELPVPPSANRWWRNVRGRMLKAKDARMYQQAVHILCLKFGRLRRGAVFPKGTKVAIDLTWHRTEERGDLDKRLGILLDALQGTVYDKDSQVRRIAASVQESTQDCVVVRISPYPVAP